MANFLDEHGLGVVWDRIKELVDKKTEKAITESRNFFEIYGSGSSGTTRTLSTANYYYSPFTSGNWAYRSRSGENTKPPWANLQNTPSAGEAVVVIKEAGWYKIDYQIYFYNSFTVNDRLASCILLNYFSQSSAGSSNERVSYGRALNTAAYQTVAGSCTVYCSETDDLRLAGVNVTGGRGTISCSALSRMCIVKVG